MEKLKPEEVLQNLPISYYVIRLDTKEIVQTNDPKTEPGKGTCFRQLFNTDLPCQLSGEKCICEQLTENKNSGEFILRKNGPTQEYFKASFKLLDENMVIANYVNVTDEFRSKKEIKKNTKRLERAERLIDFGYWEFNIDDKIMLSSKGARKVYGLSKSEVPLEEVQKIPLPPYREKLDKSLKELVERGKPYKVKFEIERPDTGEIRCIHSIAEYREDKRMVFGVIHDITEKVKSENALEESLIDLKFAQQIAKVGNWKFNPENRKLVWSDELFTIFKRDPKSGPLSISEHEKYFNNDDFLKFRKLTSTAVKSGKPFDLQAKMQLPDKTEKWIEVICKPLQKSEPYGHFLRGTIQDISESKKIEEELNNSNKLLRTVIDMIPDSIYMKDRNSRKLIANKGDAKHCGVSNVNEIIGKSDYDIYPKEVAEAYARDDKKVLIDGEKIINREEILPDGEKKRWVLTSKIPLRNGENEIVGLVGIGRDITEFKEQELRLQLLQQTIEQSPLSILITDTEGIIEYVNPGYTRITGFSRNEVVGKKQGIVKSGKIDDPHFKNLWDTIRSGNNWYGEFRNNKKDGTFYWESAVIAPIFNEKHEIKHFVSINEDITEKKQMIKELEIARDKAEESDRLKSLFLANMSHEIRTPLNGILGFSNIICSGIDSGSDKMDYYGNIINNCGQRLITVIDDIIDISMIQSNQLKIEYSSFNINELLQEVFVMYKTQKTEYFGNIDFKAEYCSNPEHIDIYSDKNRVFQVFKNLLENAFKFTESGFIRFGCSNSNEEELTLFVADSGIGIEENKTNVIFESFRQAEEGNSKKYDGSGLGLAIVNGIMERLGGKVWIESEVGKGSTFYVSLPRNEQPIEESPKAEISIPEPKKRVNGKKRIVSFEDDGASIEYLKSVVELLGYDLVNFELAREGIEYLENNKVDLVLMDVQLPEMNGYDATREIKSRFPNLPVIIQTAYAMKGDMERALETGCEDYISKPVSFKVLKEKILQYIEKRL